MVSSTDDSVQRVKDLFGDHLTEKELAFLLETRQLFKAVLQKQRGFGIVVETVSAKLKSFLRKAVLPARLRLAFDAQLFRDTFDVDSLKIDAAPEGMTEKEARFAQDVIDAIDFVIRNGIGFGLMASALSHDLMDIAKPGSLEGEMFIPMVRGWAEYNRQTPGPTEPEDF